MAMDCWAVDAVDAAPAVALFRSLGDPTRLAIVLRLVQGEARVVDLTRHLGLAQATVSKHLAGLRDCRRVDFRVAATISYNVIEAVVALVAGTVASSIALVGFGLDSVIEVSSAAAVAWQFSGTDPQRRERTALRIIAGSFFALAAYVTVEAVRSLL